MPLLPIVLTTPRLRVRPVAADDLPDLLVVNGDDETTRYLPYASWRTLEDGSAWLARMAALVAGGTALQCVIERRTDGRVIGTLLLFRHDEGSARVELGYVIGRAHWRQGYAREALQVVGNHLLRRAGLRRLEAEVDPDNIASMALLAALGFVAEGRLRQRWVAKGRTYDTVIHGCLADDWRVPAGAVRFEPLQRADLPLLHEWLGRPHVAAWWGPPPSLAEVEDDYGPMTDPGAGTRGHLAWLDGEPIGFVQCYVVLGSGDGWWEDETDPGARGVDCLLADGDRLGQGLGSTMLRAFVDRLFEDPAVTVVQTDPSPDNPRAIGAYRRAGFEDQGPIVTPDGPALLMRRRRPGEGAARSGCPR